jgi:hypothetical protein
MLDSPGPWAVSHKGSFARRAVVYTGRRRLHMGATVAFFVSLGVSVFVSLGVCFFICFLPSIMSGEQWRAAQDRARARRMAEHRMNARLLRLNL